MKILWYSNSPTAKTGYGAQTAMFVPRIRDAGHELAVASNFGIEGFMLGWDGVPVMPRGHDNYSNDIIGGHAGAWFQGKPGWVVTLYDVWTLKAEAWAGLNVASWVPVDHDPAPTPVIEWCRNHYAIAMSRFGQRVLEGFGIPARYVPHGVERSVFKPTPLVPDGRTFREAAGIPADAYLVGIVNANQGVTPPRKAWGENLQAAGELMRRHGDAWLYLHTSLNGPNRLSLGNLLRACGIPRERVVMADQYRYAVGDYSNDELAAIYTGLDVLLATSYGEGFGLTALEATACGTPVIGSDFAATPEVIGDTGWLVPVQRWWDPFQEAWFGIPLVPEIVNALEAAYGARGHRERSERCVAWSERYDADRVMAEHWAPVLADLEGALKKQGREPAPVLNRAARRASARKGRAA